MISVEDCEFIKKFEVANSEEKQIILTNEAHQVSHFNIYFPFRRLSVHASDAACFRTVPNENKGTAQFVKFLFHWHAALTFLFYVFQCAKTFLNLMAHISKEQTVQYILTLIDDTLQVQTDLH